MPPDERYDHLIEATRQMANGAIAALIGILLATELQGWVATFCGVMCGIGALASLFIAGCEIYEYQVERRYTPTRKDPPR